MRGGATHLGGLKIILGAATGELVQQRLEEVEDQVGVLTALAGQVVDDDLVVLHQVLVADVDLSVLQEREASPQATGQRKVGKGPGGPGGPRVGPPRTGTEYMVLMLLRNFSVASMNRLSMGVF